MSLEDQNNMLQILNKNGVSRKNVERIMSDLKSSGVFCDKEEEYEDDSWELIDQQADIIFSDMDPKEKVLEMKRIRSEISEKNNIKQHNKDVVEQRILNKIEEIRKNIFIKPEDIDEEELEEELGEDNEFRDSRYGRSPLHEAIAARDLLLIQKYLVKGVYVFSKDNNGHTPLEMAFYDGYAEAVDIFIKYQTE